jgi:hypothetical protein
LLRANSLFRKSAIKDRLRRAHFFLVDEATASFQSRRNVMSIKSKLVIAAAVATFGFAAPAFAQEFAGSWGTGNELPSYFDKDGALHTGAPPPQQNQIARRENGANAVAMGSRAPGGQHNQIAGRRNGANHFAMAPEAASGGKDARHGRS